MFLQVDKLLSGISQRPAMHKEMLLRMAVAALEHLSSVNYPQESGSSFQSKWAQSLNSPLHSSLSLLKQSNLMCLCSVPVRKEDAGEMCMPATTTESASSSSKHGLLFLLTFLTKGKPDGAGSRSTATRQTGALSWILRC